MQLILMLFLILTLSINATVKAVFDIGSGKIKMQIAKIEEETKEIESLFCLAIPFTFSGNEIEKEDLNRLQKILEELKQEADRYDPIDFVGIATERFRQARNGEESLIFLSQQTGINIVMIDSYEEGIFGFLTAVNE